MCDEGEWVQRSALGNAGIRARQRHLPQSAHTLLYFIGESSVIASCCCSHC